MGTPKSFTSSTYDFFRKLGIQDLVPNNKEGCFYYDQDDKHLSDNFYIDGTLSYMYKPWIYEKIKSNTILFLDYQDKVGRYFSQLQMNYENLDATIDYDEGVNSINEWFKLRPFDNSYFQ